MNDALIAEAEIGEEARNFLEGNLGKCLIGMAMQEVAMAQEALETVDPEDKKTITQLQNHAWRGRKFGEWLRELVQNGDNAMMAFKQQQEGE